VHSPVRLEVTACTMRRILSLALPVITAPTARDSLLSSLAPLARTITDLVLLTLASALLVPLVTTVVPLASQLPLRSAKKDSSVAVAALLPHPTRVARLATKSVMLAKLAWRHSIQQ
jgi:hypothetical protein